MLTQRTFRRSYVVEADDTRPESHDPPRPDAFLSHCSVTPIKVKNALFGAYVRITEIWYASIESEPEYVRAACKDDPKFWGGAVKVQSVVADGAQGPVINPCTELFCDALPKEASQ